MQGRRRWMTAAMAVWFVAIATAARAMEASSHAWLIVCAFLFCPGLRAEPCTANQLEAQLDNAARTFLANPTKGLVPGADGKTAKCRTWSMPGT